MIKVYVPFQHQQTIKQNVEKLKLFGTTSGGKKQEIEESTQWFRNENKLKTEEACICFSLFFFFLF